MSYFKKNRGNVRNRQQAQGARKAQAQKGAVNSHSNEGAENQAAAKTSRKRRVDPMLALCVLIMSMFKRLPVDLQKTETKVSCINAVLAKHREKCGDSARFYSWLLARAEEIRRTYDFKPVCESKGLTSEDEQQAVAEHLVLEGKATCTNIRLNGLATYDGDIRMFRNRLVPKCYHYEAEKAKEGEDA